MNTPPVCVSEAESLENAARHMADAGVGALPVVDGDRVIGASPNEIWWSGRWHGACRRAPRSKGSCRPAR
ncbi:CBS domain-containing protein [Streptomyces sp. NPDC058431]